jgi:hypothetical protein
VYRTPSEALRGAWARHIDAWMQRERLSIQAAHDRLHGGLHMSPKSRTAFRAIYLGKRQPNEDEAKYLATVMGWPPDPDAEPIAGSSDMERLIASNLRLSAAIEEQNRLSRDQVEELRSTVDALRVKVSELIQGTGAQVQDFARRLTVLEDRVLPPPRGGRASGGSAGRSSASGARR